MNTINLIGRLTADAETRTNENNKVNAKFTLAVDRGLTQEQKDSGKQSTDFFICNAWNSTAEYISKYIKKGNLVGIVGSLRNDVFDKEDGTKGYYQYILIQRLQNLTPKPKNEQNAEYPFSDDTFNPNEVVVSDDDLPF